MVNHRLCNVATFFSNRAAFVCRTTRIRCWAHVHSVATQPLMQHLHSHFSHDDHCTRQFENQQPVLMLWLIGVYATCNLNYIFIIMLGRELLCTCLSRIFRIGQNQIPLLGFVLFAQCVRTNRFHSNPSLLCQWMLAYVT